jgi:hypothetical protein
MHEKERKMALYYSSDGHKYVTLTPDMVEVHEESPHGHVLIHDVPGHVVEVPLVKYRHALAAVPGDEARGLRTVIYP